VTKSCIFQKKSLISSVPNITKTVHKKFTSGYVKHFFFTRSLKKQKKKKRNETHFPIVYPTGCYVINLSLNKYDWHQHCPSLSFTENSKAIFNRLKLILYYIECNLLTFYLMEFMGYTDNIWILFPSEAQCIFCIYIFIFTSKTIQIQLSLCFEN
jgi:hypothetical protein